MQQKVTGFSAVMLKPVNVICVLVFAFCAVCLFGQDADKTPPKELLQYFRDAQKAGLKPAEIQKNAVDAGWPAGTVTDAMAYLESHEKSDKGTDTKTSAESAPAAPRPGEMAANSGATSAAAKPAGNSQPEPAASNPATPDSGTPPPPGSGPPATPNTAAPAASSPPAAEPNTAAAAPATGSAAPTADPAAAPKETKPGAANAAGADASAPHIANLSDEYKIGAGDVLKITVWHEPDASLPSAVVLPSGRISVPLLHEVDVAGLTVPQLEKLLTDRFSSLINTPEVSVVVMQMNSKKIYLTGKVKREGPLPYVYEMTVMQALTEAGGVTDFAKKKAIYVLRTENGKQFKLPFDYAAVLKGEHLETNRTLVPGDMIVVP
jgi:polysaccharide export outer membrane protein